LDIALRFGRNGNKECAAAFRGSSIVIGDIMKTEKISSEIMIQRVESLRRNMCEWEAHSYILSDFDISLQSVDPDSSSLCFILKMKEAFLNGRKVLHGGLAATLLDRCLAFASAAYSPEYINVTQDMHIQYMKPVFYTENLPIYVKINHVGSRSISMSAEIRDDNEVCIFALSTFARTKKGKNPREE